MTWLPMPLSLRQLGEVGSGSRKYSTYHPHRLERFRRWQPFALEVDDAPDKLAKVMTELLPGIGKTQR